MCIICNLSDSQNHVADAMAFLDAYGEAQRAMKAATDAMLKVSQLDLKPEYSRRYDSAHKQMKRVMREWNMIEHLREQDHPVDAS